MISVVLEVEMLHLSHNDLNAVTDQIVILRWKKDKKLNSSILATSLQRPLTTLTTSKKRKTKHLASPIITLKANPCIFQTTQACTNQPKALWNQVFTHWMRECPLMKNNNMIIKVQLRRMSSIFELKYNKLGFIIIYNF